MPVPFGLFVNDFVTFVTLFKDIDVALEDNGGAS